MLLGIDYGTTRTVAAAVEKGNYPVASFENECGGLQDWYPSTIAVRGTERRYGFEAVSCPPDGSWTILLSLKRRLGELGPDVHVFADLPEVSILQLLTEFLARFQEDLRERFTRHFGVWREIDSGSAIEELYSCDENGVIEVTIINHASGHQRSYRLRSQSPAARKARQNRFPREH